MIADAKARLPSEPAKADPSACRIGQHLSLATAYGLAYTCQTALRYTQPALCCTDLPFAILSLPFVTLSLPFAILSLPFATLVALPCLH